MKLCVLESWMDRSPGIEVSQINLDDTDLKDMTLSSRALSPKSVIEGDTSLVTDSTGNGTTSVLHNLPYPPAHLFFFNPGNVNAQNNPGMTTAIDREKSTTWGLMDNDFFSVTANATTCIVNVQLGVKNTLYKIHYFIFEEPAKS